MRSRSTGPDPRPHPVGRGWPDLPDEVQRRLELAEDRGGANEQRDQADDGRERAPLRVRRSENAGHEFAASRAHKTFELGRELSGHLLSIEHQPDHADDEQHQRREGQGGVVGQRGGQPQAVVVPPVLGGA